jgi:hypothetical protein
MTPWALLAIQLARIYLEYAELSKDLTEEEAAEAWTRTQERATMAKNLWERAGR